MNEKFKQKKGSAKVVLLIIILLLLILAGVGAYLITQTDVINLNFSAKSKFISAFTDVGEKVSENSLKEKESSFNNEITGKPVEYSLNVSGNIEELEIPDMTATQSKAIRGLINESNLKLNLSADTNKDEIFGELLVDDEVLGEVVYNSDAMALKIPSIEPNYMTIFKESLEGSSYESLVEIFDYIDNFELQNPNLDDLEFTTEEIKHFTDVYSNIFKDYVTDDMLSSEKTEITIDGNNKSCDKITLNLDSKQASELIGKYITAFENDDKGREILISKYTQLMKASSSYEIMLDELGYTEKEYTDELNDSFDEVIDSMKELEEEIKDNKDISFQFIAYADMFKTYKIEASMNGKDGNELSTVINIKDDGLYTETKLSNSSDDLMVINMNFLKNAFNVNLEYEEGLKVEMNWKKEDKNTTLTSKVNYMDQQIFKLNINSTEETNTDKEMKNITKLDVAFDYDDIKLSGTVNLDESAKIVDSINIPVVNKSNSVDVIETKMLDALIENLMPSNLGTSNNDIVKKAQESRDNM